MSKQHGFKFGYHTFKIILLLHVYILHNTFLILYLILSLFFYLTAYDDIVRTHHNKKIVKQSIRMIINPFAYHPTYI